MCLRQRHIIDCLLDYDLTEESYAEILCIECNEIITITPGRNSFTYCVTCSRAVHHSCLLKSESSLTFRLSYTCPRCKYRQVAPWGWFGLIRCERPSENSCGYAHVMWSRMMRGLPVPEPAPVMRGRLSMSPPIEPPTSSSELVRLKNSLKFSMAGPGTPSTSANEIVKQLLALGAIATVLDYSLEMPIHKAIKANNTDVVKTLLSHSRVEQNSRLNKERTILHHATQYGSLEMVKLLVKSGCNINMRDCIGETPIFMAANRGNVPIMKYLVQKGAEVNLEVSSYAAHFDKRTLLHRTVWHGHIEATRWLLKKGLNPDCPSSYKYTPLHIAAENGDVEMAKLLFNYGANLESRCDANRTPLQVANQFKHVEIVQFLLFPPERERFNRSNKSICCEFF